MASGAAHLNPTARWGRVLAVAAAVLMGMPTARAEVAAPFPPVTSPPVEVPERTTVPPREPSGETSPTPSAREPPNSAPARPVSRRTVIRLDIPLLVDSLPIGEVPAIMSVQGQLLGFDGASFMKLVDRFFLPEKLAVIRQRIGANGQLAVADIRAAGIAVDYDASHVEARLGIPIPMRSTQSLSLVQSYGPAVGEVTGPANVSAYVNFLAGKSFVSAGQPYQPLVVDFDSAVSVFGNTLESLMTYRDDHDPLQRGNTRLIHDDVNTRTRYSLGDVTYGVDGFQSSQHTGGIAIQRNFGLQPYRTSAPIGQTQLNLDRASRVDVLVNGQRMQTLDLGPGRYNIRDFPLVGGTNDVTLRVTDEVGRVNIINFPFVFDSTLLAEGEQDFSYVAGAESRTTQTGIYYDGPRVVSAYHAYGLSDVLTVGANYQAAAGVKLGGAEARWATGVGTFRFDAAVSGASFEGTGAAVRVQHRFTEPPTVEGLNRNLTSTITYRSIDFTALGDTQPSNPTSVYAGFVYGQRLIDDLYGSIGFDRQFGRSGQASINSVDVNFSLPITDEITSYLLLSTRQASSGGNDNRVFFSISWFPQGSGHRLGASYDTASQTRRLDYSYTPSTRVDVVQADMSAARDIHNDSFQGQIGYTGYRFNTSAFRSNMISRGSGGGHDDTTTLNFGTAVAFADGYAAVTRPITDSFALFAPHPTLADQSIEINTVDEKPEARSDFAGPPVLPELNSYYQKHVTIEAPDLPLGYDLGKQTYDLQPTYRSGTLIKVGTGATVMGDGYLVDADGKPLPLEPGKIESLDRPNSPAIEFFTSRAGRFRVEGLQPGRFRITLANDPEHAVEFTIAEGSKGRVDLGRLTYRMEH